MDIVQIAKQSLTTAWNHKYLWLFGLFMAGASGGGVRLDSPRAGATLGALPTWAMALLAGAALLGLLLGLLGGVL